MSDRLDEQLVAGLAVGMRYRLLEPIGRGGMGAVWSAEHTVLGHRVAIKFLDSGGRMTAELRTRFEREARLCAQLGEASRHIARVVDYGVLDGTAPYFVLEFLRGRSLAAALDGPKSLAFAVEVCRQIGFALQVAHEAGVVHRDIKPGNVFLCDPEPGAAQLVKLLDFGIAKASRTAESDGSERGYGDEEPTTRSGQLLGTPSYMSPEQLTGDRDIDLRSDLWSLTALVYRVVCGEPPFGAGDAPDIGIRVLTHDPPPPSARIAGLPPAFDRWVSKGLSKRKADRFQTVTELADALAAVLLPPGEVPSRASLVSAKALEIKPESAISASGTKRAPELPISVIEGQAMTRPAEELAPDVAPRRPRWPFVVAALLVPLALVLAARGVFFRAPPSSDSRATQPAFTSDSSSTSAAKSESTDGAPSSSVTASSTAIAASTSASATAIASVASSPTLAAPKNLGKAAAVPHVPAAAKSSTFPKPSASAKKWEGAIDEAL